MQAFLDVEGLDQLSALDALRLGAACRGAREALGEDGVAAAALACVRSIHAIYHRLRAVRSATVAPELGGGSLGSWRRGWAACAEAARAHGVEGGSWLRHPGVYEQDGCAVQAWPVGLVELMRVEEELQQQEMPQEEEEEVHDFLFYLSIDLGSSIIGLLLVFSSHRNATSTLCMLVLLEDGEFATVQYYCQDRLAGSTITMSSKTSSPLDLCDMAFVDDLGARVLRARAFATSDGLTTCHYYVFVIPGYFIEDRIARDGDLYDFHEFLSWYGSALGRERWREAPVPQTEETRALAASRARDSALAELLTRSAPAVTAELDHADPAAEVDPTEAAVHAEALLASFIAGGRFPEAATGPDSEGEEEDAGEAILNAVTAELEHMEPAAEVDPVEAAVNAEALLASFVADGRFPGAAAGPAVDSEGEEEHAGDAILKLDMNRAPRAFWHALKHGLALRACRRALEAAGHGWRLLSGAWVFVHPRQYRSAMRALNGHELLRSHVIVAGSLEHMVAESLGDVGRGAWVRARVELPWPAGAGTDRATAHALDADALWDRLEVRRTFLCEAAPLRPAATVAQSTTEAQEGAGTNPRRAAPAE